MEKWIRENKINSGLPSAERNDLMFSFEIGEDNGETETLISLRMRAGGDGIVEFSPAQYHNHRMIAVATLTLTLAPHFNNYFFFSLSNLESNIPFLRFPRSATLIVAETSRKNFLLLVL